MDEVALHGSFELVDPAEVRLAAGELHVWAVPLAGDAVELVSLLSPAEHDRAARFHFADHRRRYEISHGALRLILGGYLGRDPAVLGFEAGHRGKPFLAGQVSSGAGPFFNLSHSGKLALIGIAGTELGLDCEKVRHLTSYYQIAEKHFSEDEFRGLSALGESDRLLAFYRCWTRKEAYIKALGEGLSMALDSFDVSLDDDARLVACRNGNGEAGDWSMLDVSPGPEFVAACALRGAPSRVRQFRLGVD
ncbi:MAG: 4'-phosphopantetheinyl transferase superfamily protein [Planctomycetes bacterium]|nr:4'-phosphopantetheinyl transferase superfamily protein [Planctomycetota bacterium]